MWRENGEDGEGGKEKEEEQGEEKGEVEILLGTIDESVLLGEWGESLYFPFLDHV